MNELTSDILSFYDIDGTNSSYLIKYFTNTKHVGMYGPHAQNVIFSNPNTLWGTVDEHNTYEINEFGLRGKIDESADIVASGCSITFGLGVPEEARWTNILSNKINKSVANLGNPGASVKSICNNIIQYCLNNKMPKEIFCLFPDFFRSVVVVDKEFFQSRMLGGVRNSLAKEDKLSLIYCNPKINRYKNSLFMEIEDKKYIEDSISPHQLILDSVNYIYVLESFCLANNIKLYWTTWDRNTQMIIERLQNIKNFKLKNFIKFLGPQDHRLNCNSDSEVNCTLYNDSKFRNSPWWILGSDVTMLNGKMTKENSHPGIHFHHHVSDLFYNLRS